VYSLISLKNTVHLSKARYMQNGILTHSFARDPSALVAEGTRLLDHGPLCPTVSLCSNAFPLFHCILYAIAIHFRYICLKKDAE
jgi:hypothetical protein